MSDIKVVIDISNQPFQVTSNKEMDVYVVDYDPHNAEVKLNEDNFDKFIPNPVEANDNYEDYGVIEKLEVDVDQDYPRQVHEYYKNIDYTPYAKALREYFNEMVEETTSDYEDDED